MIMAQKRKEPLLESHIQWVLDQEAARCTVAHFHFL